MERWLKIVGVTVALVLVVFFVLYHHSPAWRQARNLALAEEWKPWVRNALSVRGLSGLTVGRYTGEGGTPHPCPHVMKLLLEPRSGD